MKVHGRETRAAWWTDEGLRYIDQRALPARLEFGLATTVDEVARAIETMAVRGAPLIGVVAAYGLALAATRGEDLAAAEQRLSRTRPTAVNLQRGLDAARAAAPDPTRMLAAARSFDEAEVAAAAAIGAHGVSVIGRNARVLTHCNAGALATAGYGTALGVIRGAVETLHKPCDCEQWTRNGAAHQQHLCFHIGRV